MKKSITFNIRTLGKQNKILITNNKVKKNK